MYFQVTQDTQSAQISQKQDGHNIHVIVKTIFPPGYQQNGIVRIYALGKMTHVRIHIVGTN